MAPLIFMTVLTLRMLAPVNVHTPELVRQCLADSGNARVSDKLLYRHCYAAYANMVTLAQTGDPHHRDDAWITAGVCEVYAGTGARTLDARASRTYLSHGLQIVYAMSEKAATHNQRVKAHWFLKCILSNGKTCPLPEPDFYKGV